MQRTALVAAVLTGCLWAAPAVRAADWTALGGEEIAQALAGRRLVYENGSSQTFRESGGTSYQAGTGLSEGRWRVGADRYCSV